MSKLYIGGDNGVTGSWFFLREDDTYSFFKTPVKKCKNYTKEEKFLNRLDTVKFKDKLDSQITEAGASEVFLFLERPMISPRRFQASLSAIRCLEATLTVLDRLNIEPIFVDSKEWQHVLLPKEAKGEELKEESLKLGKKLYPLIDFKKDADAALIATWAKQNYTKPISSEQTTKNTKAKKTRRTREDKNS